MASERERAKVPEAVVETRGVSEAPTCVSLRHSKWVSHSVSRLQGGEWGEDRVGDEGLKLK